jgi:uncharacterized damage-inducible protein DinB
MSRLDERAAVLHYLRAQRRSVLAIVVGLDDQQMNSSVVASGWTPAGLLRHLGDAERHWFQEVLAGQVDPNEEVPGNAASAPAVGYYRQQVEHAERIVATRNLDEPPAGRVTPEGMAAEITTGLDVVLHMIEETARHAGHLDIARELLDGRTGLGPR